MTPVTPRERAEFFVAEVWPRVSSLGDPFRGLKMLALSLAHDVLDLTSRQEGVMWIEVVYASGQVGRYPVTGKASVTVQEPAQEPVPGTKLEGARFAFAMEGVASISLEQGDLSPMVEAPAEPVAVPGPTSALVSSASSSGDQSESTQVYLNEPSGEPENAATTSPSEAAATDSPSLVGPSTTTGSPESDATGEPPAQL